MKRFPKLFILVALPLFCVLFTGCALQPISWTPPEKPALTGAIAENELLQTTEWINLNGWYGPEDVEADSLGNLYCGVHTSPTDFTDGRILKVDTSGVVSVFCDTKAWVAGLHFDAQNNLIACHQGKGLVSINPEGELSVLASEDEKGNKFLIPNDVDIASDGMIYFSNTSSKVSFSRLNARKIIFEAKPDGGLYRYNPLTKQVTTLIDSSYFGNGVAVAPDDSFVLLVDLTKYRVIRYWLKGDKKGQTDVFMENLPGLPNGISRREAGGFWLGFTTRRDDVLDYVQPNTFLKKLVFSVPLWMQPKQESFGMFMQVSTEGEIVKTYYDTTGKKVSEASSIEEHDGVLYIGGDLTDHIGRFTPE